MLPLDDAALLALAGLPDPPPPEQGLFRRGCWLRTVSGEPALLMGGGRALLLEVAHPLVAAGVAQHSNFRTDPFGRLQRTLDAMTAIAFGDRAAALGAARSVERAHARVHGELKVATGRFPAGTPYSGRDPELMRWVWATLVDTALAMYERFVAALEPDAREAYYADQRVMARLLGVPAEIVPETHEAFRAWFDATLESDVLAVGAEGREIAEAVLRPPRDVPGAGLVRALCAALLPPRLREAFGLAWDPERADRLEHLTASVRSLRRSASAGDGKPG